MGEDNANPREERELSLCPAAKKEFTPQEANRPQNSPIERRVHCKPSAASLKPDELIVEISASPFLMISLDNLTRK